MSIGLTTVGACTARATCCGFGLLGENGLADGFRVDLHWLIVWPSNQHLPQRTGLQHFVAGWPKGKHLKHLPFHSGNKEDRREAQGGRAVGRGVVAVCLWGVLEVKKA